MKPSVKRLLSILQIPLLPVTAAVYVYLRLLTRSNMHRLPLNLRLARKIGVFPIRDHFYEPMFDPRHLVRSLRDERRLPGIDWNIDQQLSLLREFHYQSELTRFPIGNPGNADFHYDNGSFGSGDAEYLYNVVRHFKPKTLVEIGSGNSTRMAIQAMRENQREDSAYRCRHVCVEPYLAPWLEEAPVEVIRRRVECVDRGLFSELGKNDVLFIDSSHVIRPQGDVVVEYLEILPTLASGVLVHIHDIFSPFDYLDEWIRKDARLWNEQYLLEAFLSHNRDFRVLGALNLLKHRHFDRLGACCPVLAQQPQREPGSFWLVRN
jgi:hypothetical protein